MTAAENLQEQDSQSRSAGPKNAPGPTGIMNYPATMPVVFGPAAQAGRELSATDGNRNENGNGGDEEDEEGEASNDDNEDREEDEDDEWETTEEARRRRGRKTKYHVGRVC